MIYSYKCNKCNNEFELLIYKLENSNIKNKCPYCNSKKINRIFKTSNISLMINDKHSIVRKQVQEQSEKADADKSGIVGVIEESVDRNTGNKMLRNVYTGPIIS